MELLKIHPNGQWTLEKKDENDYNSYRPRTLDGRLPVDRGTKGELHNSSNTRPPKNIGKPKMEGKVPTPTTSAYDDQHPGVGA